MRATASANVKRSGVYNVIHRGHRRPHHAILHHGESFPECLACGTSVVYEFFESLTESDEIEHIGYDPDFMDSVLRTLAKAG